MTFSSFNVKDIPLHKISGGVERLLNNQKIFMNGRSQGEEEEMHGINWTNRDHRMSSGDGKAIGAAIERETGSKN